MSVSKPYLTHLETSSDLVTTYEATRTGFVTAALEKNKLADPFIAEARTLRVKAAKANRPQDLLHIEDIQPALLTAAGVSDKALAYLHQENHTDIINEFLRACLKSA